MRQIIILHLSLYPHPLQFWLEWISPSIVLNLFKATCFGRRKMGGKDTVRAMSIGLKRRCVFTRVFLYFWHIHEKNLRQVAYWSQRNKRHVKQTWAHPDMEPSPGEICLLQVRCWWPTQWAWEELVAISRHLDFLWFGIWCCYSNNWLIQKPFSTNFLS